MMIAIFTAKRLIFLFHRRLYYWRFATSLRRLFLGRAVPMVQVTFQQFGDFVGGGWLPNFVQRS
jgi:hypothetical protein